MEITDYCLHYTDIIWQLGNIQNNTYINKQFVIEYFIIVLILLQTEKSRPALGLTVPPVQWEMCSVFGDKATESW